MPQSEKEARSPGSVVHRCKDGFLSRLEPRRGSRCAVRPRRVGIEKSDRLPPHPRPRRPIGERSHPPPPQKLRLIRREGVAGLAVADQFTMTADARGDDDALLSHSLERLEG